MKDENDLFLKKMKGVTPIKKNNTLFKKKKQKPKTKLLKKKLKR